MSRHPFAPGVITKHKHRSTVARVAIAIPLAVSLFFVAGILFS